MLCGLIVLGNQLDAETNHGLERTGLRLTSGEDDSGWFMRYFETGGGYYINVGDSETIIRRDVKVRQLDQVDHFVENGFTGQVTAAGTVPPAKVLVAGAGVAGLAAIGARAPRRSCARRPRPEVADQVKSIGGNLKVEVEEDMKTSDGYAKGHQRGLQLAGRGDLLRNRPVTWTSSPRPSSRDVLHRSCSRRRTWPA